MKKILFPLLIVIFTVNINAQTIDYDKYFTDKSLRMDVFQCGMRDTSHYVFDKFIIEQYFGGSKVNLIDNLNFGTNRVKVVDATSNNVIYTHGYNTLFQEWQNTDEALVLERCYEESVSVPLPKNKAFIVLEIRNRITGDFDEIFSKLFDPNEIFNSTEQRYIFPVYDVLVHGNPSEKVDVIILPEGYTEDEMEKFKTDCNNLVNILKKQEPFSSHINDFNFRAVLAPSEESGTDIPSENKWVRTILNSHFNTFYIDRYCTTRNYFSVKDVAANAPYDQIYILVNSNLYGGGGLYNYYSLSTSGNMSADKVIIHEFGHAFAGLADEYEEPDSPLALLYNLEIEPWEANLTTLVDFDSKWSDLVEEDTPIPTSCYGPYGNKVGAFEGGGYLETGMYRPQCHCMMRDYFPFCAVCYKTIEDVIAVHCDTTIDESIKYPIQNNHSFNVYPNPTSKYINIYLNNVNSDSAEIIDINGNVVLKIDLDDKIKHQDVSMLSKGIYFVKIDNEIVKFVKN